MTKYGNPIVVMRGFFGTLCIITMVVSNYKIAYADSTTDDLKAFLGFTVEKHEEVNRYESNYGKLIEDTSETSGDVHIDKEVELSEVDILNQNLSVYGMELDKLVKEDKSPYEIKNKLDLIIDTKNEVKQLGYSTSEQSLIDDNKDYSAGNLVVYESYNDINSRWYNIGDIGNNLKFPLAHTRIVRPYGYEVVFDNDLDKYVPNGDKNMTLWLNADINEEVKASYNGVILSIEDDSLGEGTKNIAIKHGNEVYTIYKHIIPKDKLKVGDVVTQYSVIGNVGKSLEEGYENHIEIGLIIDRQYINPLLMYGTSGEKIYNELLRSSDREYAVERGEVYYWNSSIAKENPNKSNN